MSTIETDPVVVQTPVGKHTVKLRPYATARLRKESRGVFLNYASLDSKMFKGKSKSEIEAMDQSEITQFQDKIPASIANEINEITLKFMIVSIELNGTSGEITDREEFVDTCLDMQDEDFNFLVEEANKIAKKSELSDEKKKD